MNELENKNPQIYNRIEERTVTSDELDDNVIDEFDSREVFDLLRTINDPEHPLTLEQLRVVREELIDVNNLAGCVNVEFTPTIPHCSMATLIGLSMKVKLLRCLPARFKIHVKVEPGTHMSEEAINKQLADKERVAAALENSHLLTVINQCISIRNNT